MDSDIKDETLMESRVALLREEMKRRDIDGFIVPRADEHQGEYVPPHAERLAWLTGFSGSAGLAMVFAETAAIFVDGRYTIQVTQEVDPCLFDAKRLTVDDQREWLTVNLDQGKRLGYDPWLHTLAEVRRLQGICNKTGSTLVALEDNPLDCVWADQPSRPSGVLSQHPLELTGKPSVDKRREVAEILEREGAGAIVLSAPDSIAWLLNIRGCDIPFAPLPLVYAVLLSDGTITLFADNRKIPENLEADLGEGVDVLESTDLEAFITRLGRNGVSVAVDPVSAPVWFERALRAADAGVVEISDPCQLKKAIKNDTELEGIRRAHVRDAVALASFLAWLDQEASGGTVTELSAAEMLESFRSRDALYKGASFATISGFGANGAIVHYRVSSESNKQFEQGSLYLVDSGGQYPDGTTDVTRTIAIGSPTDEMCQRFTRVLKGHIALAMARFPAGTTGSQLDVLARRALWEVGLDYDHGTGHGVGCFLSVHEGPQRISKIGSTIALKPGMVVSNEPGYYKEGAYGIRIENLVAVRQAESLQGGEKDMLEFEILTISPIDRRLVDPSLLNPRERNWLNAYHARVRDTLSPLIDEEIRGWLKQATEPL